MGLVMLAEAVELGQLAEELTGQGYEATVITPAPYLAIQVPGTALPYLVYSSSGHFWWHTAQVISPCGQVGQAAELITWGLRAAFGGPAAHDTASPGPASAGPPACGPAAAGADWDGGGGC